MADDTPTLAPLFTWRAAICESDMDSTTKLVAFVVSFYMNERGGSAFPGAVRIASDASLHESTVRERLRELRDQGWLTQTERGGRRGQRRRANAYQASIPPLAHGEGYTCTPRPRRSDPSPGALLPLAVGEGISSLNTSEISAGEAVETEPARSRADAAKMLRTLKGTLRNEQVLTTEPAQE